MTVVDFEAEYDTRAAAPDHPAVFAGRTGDGGLPRAGKCRETRRAGHQLRAEQAANHRSVYAEASGGGRAAHGIHSRRLLARRRAGDAQLCGAWTERPWRRRRVDRLQPDAASAIPQIIEQARVGCLHLWRRFNRRMLVTGHSAADI